jgi:hypothetical protein
MILDLDLSWDVAVDVIEAEIDLAVFFDNSDHQV